MVKRRLSSAGLGDFCLELHSNKVNKLALLESLSQRLKLNVSPIQNMVQKLSEMESKKAVLLELSKVLESRDSESGQTVQEILMEATSLRLFSRNHLRHEDFERLAKAKAATPAYPRLAELHDHLTDLMSLHVELNSGVLEHPWRAIGRARIDRHSSDIIRLLEAASEDGASLLATLVELSSSCGCQLVEDFQRIQSLVDISAHFEASGVDIWHAVVPSASDEKAVLKKFQQELRNHAADRSMLTQTFRGSEAERISNSESLATAVERLIVDFGGYTLPVVEQVISAIGEVCDLLSATGDLLTIIQTTFALPSTEDERWAATIQATLESVAVAPKDICRCGLSLWPSLKLSSFSKRRTEDALISTPLKQSCARHFTLICCRNEMSFSKRSELLRILAFSRFSPLDGERRTAPIEASA